MSLVPVSHGRHVRRINRWRAAARFWRGRGGTFVMVGGALVVYVAALVGVLVVMPG